MTAEPTASKLLAGTFVVDAGQGVAPGFASWLLADLGARVVMVEPPGGGRMRHLGPFPDDTPDADAGGLHLALNAGKESMVLDLEAEAGRRALRELLDAADLYIAPGPSLVDSLAIAGEPPLSETLPALVRAVHTPFGADGPYAGRATSEIVDWAMGGYMYFCGDPGRAPLMLHGHQAELHAGMQLAFGCAVALWHAGQTGRGQRVDVSTFESMMSAHVWYLSSWLQEGLVWRRKGSTLNRCADGYFVVGAPGPEIFLLIDRAELMLEERYLTDHGWRAALPEVMRMLEDWAADKTMADIYRRGQEARVKVAPVNTVADLAASPQLASRSWWRTAPHPQGGELNVPRPPWRFSTRSEGQLAAAPRLAEGLRRDRSALPRRALPPLGDGGDASGGEAAPGLPFEGLRVVEATSAWAGPLAGRHLADLGADVVLVERGSVAGTRGHHFPGGSTQVWPRFYDRGGAFNLLNRNKRGTVINLRSDEGKELFRRLVDGADVLIENSSPRVFPSLGLDYDSLARRNPRLVMCSMSGFGATGPEAHYRALGSSIEASSGLVAQTGYAPGDLYTTGSFHADPIGGTLAALAIVAALRERNVTGRGQHIDLSLQESGALFLLESIVDYGLNGRIAGPRGNRSNRIAPQGAYPSAGDDCWLAIGVESDAQWRALCEVIGSSEFADRHPDCAARRAAHEEIDHAIVEWSRGLDHQDAARRLQAHGVPAAPVLANWEAASDPQLAHTGFWIHNVHPEVGYQRWEGVPWRLSKTPARMRRPAPLLAQHNDEVLSELLGIGADELMRLREGGVIVDRPDNTAMFATPSQAGP